MSDVLIDQDTMEDIGDAIREKLGVSDTYLPASMPAAIRSISGGGNTLVIQDASIYSTDEQQVGVWVNGKPLYQKTFIFSNISTLTGNQSYQTDLSNIDEAFLEGEIIEGVNRYAIPWAGLSGHALGFFFSTSTNYIWTKGTDNFSNATLKITVKYTKTTDTPGSGGYKAYGLSPIIYSEEEREIGVWTDGKPLYQKTFNISNPPASSVMGSIDVSALNIDACIIKDGYFKLNDGQSILAINEGFEDRGWCHYYNDEIRYLTKYTATKVVVTLLYTKTTDTPGSGIWTTTGEYAHHYSTDEKVVGTWIDGKPLYEKVFTGLSVALNGINWVNLVTIQDAEFCLSVKAYRTQNTSYAKIPIAECDVYNGNIRVSTVSSQFNMTINVAIVQYTKTA